MHLRISRQGQWWNPETPTPRQTAFMYITVIILLQLYDGSFLSCRPGILPLDAIEEDGQTDTIDLAKRLLFLTAVSYCALSYIPSTGI